MIILLVIIFAIASFISWTEIKAQASRWLIGGASILLLALSVIALWANINNHWGMKKIEETSAKQIYSAGPANSPMNFIIKAPVGTDSKNYVFVYKDNPSDAQPVAHFKPNEKKILEAIKKTATYETLDADQAKVVITTTKWDWSNSFTQLLFGIGGQAGELVSEKAIVQVPKTGWTVLTQEEAQKLQQQMQMIGQ